MFLYEFLRIAFIKEPPYKRNGETAFVLGGDRSISDGKETDEDAWKTPVLSLKAQDSIIPVEYPNGKEGLVVRGGGPMVSEYPKHFLKLKEKYPELIKAYESAGELAREAGPLQDKFTHLVQMAACVALRSEGGVHSHTRRALEAGATPEEIYHALVLLISTAGFPTVSAGVSWVNDVIEKKAR